MRTRLQIHDLIRPLLLLVHRSLHIHLDMVLWHEIRTFFTIRFDCNPGQFLQFLVYVVIFDWSVIYIRIIIGVSSLQMRKVIFRQRR